MFLITIFPVLGLFLNLFLYLFKDKIDFKKRNWMFLKISLSFGILALCYYRIDNQGDITKYILQYNNMNENNFVLDSYSLNYPLWYLIVYLLKKYDINFQFLNLLCIFIIYYINFYIILKLKLNLRIEKLLIIKILTYYSFVILFSSYRGTLCFSLIMLGIINLIQNYKFKGSLFCILGSLIHPIGYVIIVIYLISLIINFNKIPYKKAIILIAIISGLINKYFVVYLLKSIFYKNQFYLGKINTYFLGYWSMYNFKDRSEVISFVLIFILLIFIILLFFLKMDNIKLLNKKYFNFIFLYLIVMLNFINFRTVFYRLSHDGFIFFLPMFANYLKYKRKKDRYSFLILFLWILILDFRNILYLFGFYKNIFYFNLNIFKPLEYLKNLLN